MVNDMNTAELLIKEVREHEHTKHTLAEVLEENARLKKELAKLQKETANAETER